MENSPPTDEMSLRIVSHSNSKALSISNSSSILSTSIGPLPTDNLSLRIALYSNPQALSISHSSSTLSTATELLPTSISFDRTKYDSIEAGRTLSPLDHPYAHQADIFLHLKYLALQNRIVFGRVKKELLGEQAHLAELNSSLEKEQLIRLNCVPSVDTIKFATSRLYPEFTWIKDVGPPILESNAGFWIEAAAIVNAILEAPNEHTAAAYLDSLMEISATHYDTIASLLHDLWLACEKDVEEAFGPCIFENDRGYFGLHHEFYAINKNDATQCDEFINTLLQVRSKHQFWRKGSLARIENLQKELGILRKEQRRCKRAAGFAKTLACLGGPFNLFGLPIELRCLILGNILRFEYDISVTNSGRKDITSEYNGVETVFHSTLWTHPIFQTGQKLRKEAGQEFYRLNTFSCRSLETLPSELGRRVISHFFRRNITKLRITLPSLGIDSIKAMKAIRGLEGLRVLTIHLNFDQLSRCPFTTIGGLNALESFIQIPNQKLPFLQSVEIFDTELDDELETALNCIHRASDSVLVTEKRGFSQPFQPGPIEYLRTPRFSPPNYWTLRWEIRDFEENFNARILHTRNPNTVSSGLQPYKPSRLFPESKKPSDEEESTPDEPIAKLLGRSEVQEKITEMKAALKGRRVVRLGIVAAEKARLVLVKRAERQNWSYLESLPFFEESISYGGFSDGR